MPDFPLRDGHTGPIKCDSPQPAERGGRSGQDPQAGAWAAPLDGGGHRGLQGLCTMGELLARLGAILLRGQAAPIDPSRTRDLAQREGRRPQHDSIRRPSRHSIRHLAAPSADLPRTTLQRYRALEADEGRFLGYPDKDKHTIDAVRYAAFDLIADPDIP